MNRLTSAMLMMAGMMVAMPAFSDARSVPASLEPTVTLLEMHPVDGGFDPRARPAPMAMPQVVRPGVSAPDRQQIELPAVQSPSQKGEDPNDGVIGKAGTGFFIAGNGTLLTAAHVTKGCGRMQIISKYLARTWVSLVAADEPHDIALLNAPGVRSPGVLHLAASAPTSGKLHILGFPAGASLTVAAEAWGVVENQKFPPNIGPMANPRDLLWMSAPDVTHGFSGGPIFDPKLGAVVGIVKGEVDGGYLRLVRDMPTSGMAVGPGIEHIQALLRREAAAAAVSLVSSAGEGGEDALHRATVRVLCWHQDVPAR